MEFTSLNPDDSHIVEDAFEKERPLNKPQRANCLYLFETIDDAKKHWSKMSEGKLYEVELSIEEILHKGDMTLVDIAFKSKDDISSLEENGKKYWASEYTECPVVEILVQQALVSGIISKDQNDRREYFISWAMPNSNLKYYKRNNILQNR